MGEDGVTGIIVPLPSEVTNRIFHHHDIYAMLAEANTTKLSVGDHIFFYDTAGTGLEGEASIEKISFEPAKDVRRYGHDLYLSDEELSKYLADAGKDDGATMLVLKVKEATKYSRPLRCSLSVGKGGHYMTGEVFARVMNEN